MTDIQNPSGRSVTSPIIQLAVALLVVAGAGGILFIVMMYTGKLLFNSNLFPAGEIPALTDPAAKYFIWYSLLAQDVSFFIVPSLIILTVFNFNHGRDVLGFRDLIVLDFFLVVFLTFFSFPLTSLTGELNAKMILPEWLSEAGQWIREKENTANDLLETLLLRDNLMAAGMNILLLAILPAVSEELIFRGVLQRILGKLLHSGHAAVWLTSLIFSTVHFQFYGFLPRFILGLLFGYLFLWTRSVWLPVTAHFINNAVPVIGASFSGWQTMSGSSSGSPDKQAVMLVMSVIIGSGILYYFYLRSGEIRETTTSHPDSHQDSL
jgi:membrane protease YdiL (CAAX protease family)